MTKTKAKKWECKTTFFPKDLAYRFSTLLVVAGCYLIMRFVITAAKVIVILLKK